MIELQSIAADHYVKSTIKGEKLELELEFTQRVKSSKVIHGIDFILVSTKKELYEQLGY